MCVYTYRYKFYLTIDLSTGIYLCIDMRVWRSVYHSLPMRGSDGVDPSTSSSKNRGDVCRVGSFTRSLFSRWVASKVIQPYWPYSLWTNFLAIIPRKNVHFELRTNVTSLAILQWIYEHLSTTNSNLPLCNSTPTEPESTCCSLISSAGLEETSDHEESPYHPLPLKTIKKED